MTDRVIEESPAPRPRALSSLERLPCERTSEVHHSERDDYPFTGELTCMSREFRRTCGNC